MTSTKAALNIYHSYFYSNIPNIDQILKYISIMKNMQLKTNLVFNF